MFPSLPLLDVVPGVAGHVFKRSQLGLFHGKMRQVGNNVPFSHNKTKRTWLPNIHNKRLTSPTLGEVKLKVTARALRAIKKQGGLDQYLTRTKPELLGWEGMSMAVKVQDKAWKERTEKNERRKAAREARWEAILREEPKQKKENKTVS